MNWPAETLKKHLAAMPEHRFLYDEETSLTFRQIDHISGQVYAFLKANGIGREDFVMINLPRGVMPFCVMLGVWRAGAAFVAVDDTIPGKRIDYIYKNTGCRLEVNRETLSIIKNTAPLDGYEDVDDHTAAFAVYTSGTTGHPKGSIHEYGNIRQAYDSLSYAGKSIFDDGEGLIITGPITFASTLAIFYSSIAIPKARLHIFPTGSLTDLNKFQSMMSERRITSAMLTASFARTIQNYELPCLKKLIVTSEPAAGINISDKIIIYNAYGSSEGCFFATLFRMDKEHDSCTIGDSRFDNKIFLLHDDVDEEDTGELCYENRYVRGYINLPDENALTFRNGYFHSGDIARKLPDGNYIIIGRKDDMANVNGNRIEPLEVELYVKKVLHIDWCAVRCFTEGDAACVAAFYAAEIPPVDVNQTRKALSEYLPAYMIPTHFVKIDKIPLSKNGKLDRRALLLPEFRSKETAAPENDFERCALDAAIDILGTELGVATNLISAGLNSIRAARLSAAISREAGIYISAGDILEHPHIRDWQSIVQQQSEHIEHLPARDFYPLTPNQLGVYLDWERNREKLQYNLPMVYKFAGADAQKLYRAVKHVIAAHLYFNVHIEEHNQIVLVRRDEAELPVLFEKLDNEPDLSFFKSRVKPFNLLKDDLARFEVYTFRNDVYLFIDVHHIIFDGSAVNILLSELDKAYNEERLEAEAASAYDFALFYEKWQKSERYYACGKYFTNLIAGTEPFMYPPKRSNAAANGKYETCNIAVPKGKIYSRCCALGITENVFFAAALCQVLHRIGRADSVQIAAVSSGRSYPQLEHTIGMFVRTLPLVSRTKSGKVSDMLAEMQKQIISTLKNDLFPYTALVEKYHITPNVMYAWQADVILSEDRLLYGQDELGADAVISPIAVNIIPDKAAYNIMIKYDCGLYRSEEIKIIGRAIRNFAESMAAAPNNADLKTLSLVSEEEKQTLIRLGTGKKLDYDSTQTLADLFLKHAHQTPQNSAVVDSVSSITYGELDRRSDVIAHELIALGVKPNDFVAIRLPRIKEFIISVIAVWKAGAAYLPIDTEYPQERIDYMRMDSGAKVIIDKDFIAQTDFRTTAIPLNRAEPDNTAYMIYTSGSTGHPKGVMVPHRALRSLAEWLNELTQAKPDDAFAIYSSFSFDETLCDLAMSIAAGAVVHIVGENVRRDLSALHNYLSENNICGLSLPTQVGMMLLNEYYDLNIRFLIAGGEKLNPVKNTSVRLINGYGPTEFTVCSSYHIVDRELDGENIPIGRPVPNCIAAVVDPAGNLMPRGMAGELALSGEQIAIGYWNRPELTDKKFVEAPFLHQQKMYLTGDLACWNENGELLYLGRTDDQIKLRGFRIELGEIESALLKISGIKSAAAAVKTINNTGRLTAYYVSDSALDETELRARFAEEMPEYMIPDAFVRLEKFPLTQNGKIDRAALPAPEIAASEYAAPQDEKEIYIADAFREVLNLNFAVGRNDDFISLGGDSIKAIRLVSKLREAGVNVTVADILKAKTAAGIAALADKTSVCYADQTEWSGEVPLSAIQKQFLNCSTLPHIEEFCQAMMLEASEHIEEAILKRALEALALHHDMLRAVYRNGTQYVRKPNDKEGLFELINSDLSQAEERADEIQRSFDLARGPLFKALLIRDIHHDRLLLVIHHLVVDGVSWRIIIEDLETAYRQVKAGEPVRLPEKTTSFRDWRAAVGRYAESSALRREIPYWKSVEEKISVCGRAVRDYAAAYGTIRTVTRSIDSKIFAALRTDALKAYNNEINDLLLSALCRAYYAATGERTMPVSLEAHGREPLNGNTVADCTATDRTVGWFTSVYPAVLEYSADMRANIRAVKETLRRIPNHGIGYGILRYIAGIGGETVADRTVSDRNELVPPVAFNYLGTFDEHREKSIFTISNALMCGNTAGNIFGQAMAVNCIGREALLAVFSYNTSIWTKEKAELFADEFIAQISAIVEHTMSAAGTQSSASDLGEPDWSDDDLAALEAELNEE